MYYEEGQVNFSQTLRDWRLRAALLHKRRGLVYNILALACVFLVVLFILDARVGDERAPAAWPWGHRCRKGGSGVSPKFTWRFSGGRGRVRGVL